MSRYTDVLVRSRDGWTHVRASTAPSRKCITQGQPGDDSNAVARARAELATHSHGQTQITIAIKLTSTDPVPGIDWAEGDELNVDGAWREVEDWSFEIVDDDTGRWTDVPRFGAIFDTPTTRHTRAIRQIGGIAGGGTILARPITTGPTPDLRPGEGVG